MKHFRVYRKLILIAGTVIAAVSVGAVLFTESASALMLLIIAPLRFYAAYCFCLTSCITVITMIC